MFQKKELVKNHNKFRLEGEIVVRTLVPPFCGMLNVAVLIRTANTIGAYLKF